MTEISSEPQSADLPAPPGDDRQRWLVLILAACAFASGFGIRIADPIVPVLAAEYGTSIATASLIVTFFALFYAFSQLIVGPIGDMIGKARMIVFCGAASALLSLACAGAPSFGALSVLRAASGFAAGAIVPLGVAVVSDRVHAELRQAAIGRFIMAPVLGQLLGGSVSGIVTEWIGWQAVFLLTAGLLIAATAGMVAIVGLARRTKPEPMSLAAIFRGYRLVFSSWRAVKLYPLVICSSIATYGIFPFIAAILFARSGAGPSEAGLVIAGFGIGGLGFGLSVKWMVRTLGPARMAMTGGTVAGCMLALFALPLHWLAAVAIFIAFGFFFFMLHNTMATQAVELAPSARATGISLYAFSMFSAQGIGPALVGPAMYVLPVAAIIVILGGMVALVGLTIGLSVVAAPQRAGPKDPRPDRSTQGDL